MTTKTERQKVTAVREFGVNGIVWFPQIFVAYTGKWEYISSVRHAFPFGFASPRDAIQTGFDHLGRTL